jgi:hypothetical protein
VNINNINKQQLKVRFNIYWILIEIFILDDGGEEQEQDK